VLSSLTSLDAQRLEQKTEIWPVTRYPGKTVDPNFSRAICFVLITIIVSASARAACARETGYDENTEIVVNGKIRQTLAGPYLGFQCFIVQTKSKCFHVLTAPHWFARHVGLNPKIGTEVEVVGSKFFGVDGSLYLLAKSLTFVESGRQIMLRDKTCKPVWIGAGSRESSCLRIFYTKP
jgi:hypothetical protein